jgi:SOS-response transcriptional repressor LexA
MFDKLCDNLNLLMAEVHISADELGRRTGVPASTIKKIRNRYNPNPTLTTLLPIARYFSLTLGQLVGDESLPTERAGGLPKANQEGATLIPILSWEQAIGCPRIQTEIPSLSITSEHAYSQDAYALIVEEDDWGSFAKDTVLIIEPFLTVEHRDYAVVYKEGQQSPTLRQILYDEDQLYLKPLVQGYNIAPYTVEHRILGIVAEYKKQLRKTIDNKDVVLLKVTE